VHWRPPSGQWQGRFRGPRRVQRVGCAKSGQSNICQERKKVDAQMPRDALSVARRLLPLETVIRGRGIVSRVLRCDCRKYMHIRTQYEHIPHIHTDTCYTYIYIHIRTGRQVVQWSEVAAAIYMQIHAYTYIYMHIPIPYVYIFQVRISVIYT